jgi:hypothetical protein
MKTDQFIIYITTTQAAEWSWICHLHAFAGRDDAIKPQKFSAGFQECYKLIHNALPSI